MISIQTLSWLTTRFSPKLHVSFPVFLGYRNKTTSQNYNFRGMNFPGACPHTPLAVYALCAGSTENCLLWACYGGISLTCLLCLKILFTPLPLPSSTLSLTGECCVKPTVPVYNACDRRTARWGRWIECYS